MSKWVGHVVWMPDSRLSKWLVIEENMPHDMRSVAMCSIVDEVLRNNHETCESSEFHLCQNFTSLYSNLIPLFVDTCLRYSTREWFSTCLWESTRMTWKKNSKNCLGYILFDCPSILKLIQPEQGEMPADAKVFTFLSFALHLILVFPSSWEQQWSV